MTDPDTPTTPSLRASSGCPVCRTRHVVDLCRVLRPKPHASYSVAGAQTKVATEEVWVWRCTRCGAAGDAQAPDSAAHLSNLPVGCCGHTMATDHYPGGDNHDAAVCAGCCPSCQATKDAIRGL